MTMPTIHQEIDPSPQDVTTSDHPVLRGLAADSKTAYDAEVAVLRERVAVLEAALAAAQARAAAETAAAETTVVREAPALTSIDFAPACSTTSVGTSEFDIPVTPAVVAVTPAAAPAPTVTPQAVAPQTATPEPVAAEVAPTGTAIAPGNVRFAEAWTEDEDATFEERVAEKAFFQASSVDQQSRDWLLEETPHS